MVMGVQDLALGRLKPSLSSGWVAVAAEHSTVVLIRHDDQQVAGVMDVGFYRGERRLYGGPRAAAKYDLASVIRPLRA